MRKLDTVTNVAFGIIMAVVMSVMFLWLFHDWVFAMLSEMRDSWHKYFGKDKEHGP